MILLINIILIIILEQFGVNIQEYIGDLGYVQTQETISYDLSEIPEYDENPYVIINNNIPNFTEEDYTIRNFEKYSQLDKIGRCGVAFANVCIERQILSVL